MARILWTSQNHLGSVGPAIPVALELRRRGHDVLAMTTEGGRARLEGLGFTVVAYQDLPDLDPSRPETTPWRVDQYRAAFVDSIAAQVPEVSRAIERNRVGLAFTDSLLSGTGLAAERCEVPWVSYTVFFFDHGRSADGFRPWWDDRRREAGLAPEPRASDEEGWIGLSPHVTLLFGLPDLLVQPRIEPPYVHRVGPVLWEPPAAAERPGWLATFGRERPGILISTSSAWHHDDDLLTKALDGLADLEVDLVATVPAHAQVHSGRSGAHLTSYCPHGWILPSAAAVVCSGGFGLVTKALCAGVPLLVVPQGGETHLVAAAISRAGAGIALDPRRCTPSGIRSAVDCLLHDPGYRRTLSRLRQAATKYDAPVTSADLIESLLAPSYLDHGG